MTNERDWNMEDEQKLESAPTMECTRLRNAVRRCGEGVHLPVALWQAGFNDEEIRELLGRKPTFARQVPIALTHPWPW